jgi:hypothetical protein
MLLTVKEKRKKERKVKKKYVAGNEKRENEKTSQ